MATMHKAPAASAWGIYLKSPIPDQKAPRPIDAKISEPPQQREAIRPAVTLPATGVALIWFIVYLLSSTSYSDRVRGVLTGSLRIGPKIARPTSSASAIDKRMPSRRGLWASSQRLRCSSEQKNAIVGQHEAAALPR